MSCEEEDTLLALHRSLERFHMGKTVYRLSAFFLFKCVVCGQKGMSQEL